MQGQMKLKFCTGKPDTAVWRLLHDFRSTQFFEFIPGIADKSSVDNVVHLSDVEFQPIASDDVAAYVAKYALSNPLNGKVEIAGPERFELNEIIERYLRETGDPSTRKKTHPEEELMTPTTQKSPHHLIDCVEFIDDRLRMKEQLYKDFHLKESVA